MTELCICLCKVCNCKYNEVSYLNKIKELEEKLLYLEKNSVLNSVCQLCNNRDANTHECDKCCFLLCDSCFKIVYEAEKLINEDENFDWGDYTQDPSNFPYLSKYTYLQKLYKVDYIDFCKHYNFRTDYCS